MNSPLIPEPAVPATNHPLRFADQLPDEDLARYYERTDPPLRKIRGKWQRPTGADLAEHMREYDARRAAAHAEVQAIDRKIAADNRVAAASWRRRDVHLRRALSVVAEVAHLAGRTDVAIVADDEDQCIPIDENGALVGGNDVDRALAAALCQAAHPDHADEEVATCLARMAPEPWTPGRIADAAAWILEATSDGADDARLMAADLAAEFAAIPVGDWCTARHRAPTRGEAKPAAEPKSDEEWSTAPTQIRTDPWAGITLPGIGGILLEHALSTAYITQRPATIGGIMALAGALIGRLRRGPRNVYGNAYWVAGVDTGKGKEHVRKIMKATIDAAGVPQLWGPNRVSSSAALERLVCERRDLLLPCDEFGLWIQTLTSPTAPAHIREIESVLLTLWSSPNQSMPLSARADGKNDRVTEGSILSVYGSTTITTLMDGLTENSIQSGLLPRIFFCPADPDAQPRFGMGEDIPSLPSEVVLAVQAWTQGHALEHACMRANKTAGLLSYDADAKALAEATEREGWERRNDQRAGPVAHLWSRFAEKAAQAAVIITWLRDQSATETTGEDYRTAAAIAKASILSLTSLAGRDLLVCGSGTEKEIRRILRIITEAGPTGIERTPIARRAKDIHSRRLDEILTTLEQAGRIQSKTITRTRPQGGDVTIEVYRATEF